MFEKFDWYAPDPRFTNRALTPLDAENLVIIDRPPPEARAAPTAAAAPAIEALPTATSARPKPANAEGACGCTTVHPAHGLGWSMVALLGLTRRRSGPAALGPLRR